MLFSRTTRVNRARFSVCLAQKNTTNYCIVVLLYTPPGISPKIEEEEEEERDDVANTDTDFDAGAVAVVLREEDDNKNNGT